jgi:hypothetical protein
MSIYGARARPRLAMERALERGSFVKLAGDAERAWERKALSSRRPSSFTDGHCPASPREASLAPASLGGASDPASAIWTCRTVGTRRAT